MIAEASGESAELDSYHCDINPGLGAGFALFVIPHEAAMAHEPAEGAFHHPTPRENFEAARAVGAFDHFDNQFWTHPANPLREVRPAVAAVHPHFSQPGEPRQEAPQEALRTIALRYAGGGHQKSQHQAQRIDQQMPLSSFDVLGLVVAHRAPVRVGFDRLTVQNSGGGARTLAARLADRSTQTGIERLPGVISSPAAEDVIDRLPRWKSLWQQPPLNAALNQIKDRVEDAPSIRRWAST